MILAGDIGGTKTNLAIFSAEAGLTDPIAEATFPSTRYSSLETIVGEFLAEHPGPVDWASFGVAGPIVDGRATITNLPWIVDANEMQANPDLPSVSLLNDLEATAWATPWLPKTDLTTLNEAAPDPHGTIVVLAPGTGLGQAYLTWDGTRHRPHAAEGGHADFAPTDEREIELLRYMLERHDHVSYERVCSGLGIPNIYAFLRDSGAAPETPDVVQQLATVIDYTPTILNAALDTNAPCPLCRATLEMFVGILGAAAGDLALTLLATGGVYLGGGIPPRILPALQTEHFRNAFNNKGRMTSVTKRTPVHVIRNAKTALLGAALHALLQVSDEG